MAFEIVHRKLANFLPTADGRYLAVGEGRTKSEVAKFSARDAERLDAYHARLGAVSDLIRALMLETPPNVTEGGLLAALPELLRAGGLARRMGALDMAAKRDLLALLGRSAGDYLDDWFESDPIKAVYGFDGIVGNYASPYTPGSGYVLLHHLLGEVNGKRGAWGHAIGGMGAITQAMAKACAAQGVDIRVDAPVREVIVEKGRAVGVACENGDGLPRPHHRLQSQSQAAVPAPGRSGPAAGRLPRPHRRLSHGFGHLPDECRAVRTAAFYLPAGARRSSDRRHHHRAQPGLYGPGL